MGNLAVEWESATPINTQVQSEWDAAVPIEEQKKPDISIINRAEAGGYPVGRFPDPITGAVYGAGTAGEQLASFAMSAGKKILNTDAVQHLLQPVKEFAKPAVQSITDLVRSIMGTDVGKAQIATGQDVKALMERFPRETETLGKMAAATNLIPVYGAVRKLGPALLEGELVATGAVKGATGAVKEKAINLIHPPPTPEGALKQVLQGKTKDLAKGKKAFAVIDTEGVKTYADLNQRITGHVQDYSRQVDNELLKDPTPYPLESLTKQTKTVGGETVSQNHVEEALNQLNELYTKINDPVRAKEVEELLTAAQEQGLTKKQVNDLSRVYGNEFGDKAFSKVNGDQLTSVNAQAYENTRKGLKDTARSGMGPEAQKLDATLSSMLNTRRLVEKNVEAVNKLQGKIDPRSPLEKVGRFAVKTADTLSGGLVRGVIGGLLPRGVGNKVFNALDLEEKLARNLKILESALKDTKVKAKVNPLKVIKPPERLNK